jgi:hypothetical protein
MDSASVERQRSCGSGRGAVRAKARGLDQSALRRIMAVSVVAISGIQAACIAVGRGKAGGGVVVSCLVSARRR